MSYETKNCVTDGGCDAGYNAWKQCVCKCIKLTKANIPNGVKSVGYSLFGYCGKLEAITIPNSVTSIGEYAFLECFALTKVIIPSGVTSIGRAAFAECRYLTEVTIPNTVTSIGALAFYNCAFASVTIPASVKSIDTSAFADIENLSIYGYSGSAADTYATENSFSFISLDDTSSLAKGKISGLTNTASGIKIKWSSVGWATGYYVYRKAASGSYSKIKTITSASTVSYTDTEVKDTNGTVYSYKIIPYASGLRGAGTAKTIVRLTGTSLTSVKNSSAGKAKVKWTAVSDVTGYQIQYSTGSSFSSYKTKKVSGAASVSKTLSSLTKGKIYYVRIRTYKTVNGKTYYSAWSSKLKVKVLK